MSLAVKPPASREAIRIAIICALDHEADLVQVSMKKLWKKKDLKFGKNFDDENTYTFGLIASHNVVLARIPGLAPGSNDVVRVAAGLRSSFPQLAVCFVVGICGAAPRHIVTGAEIILGDPIISGSVIVRSDFGRLYQQGLARKHDTEDVLGRANPAIRAFVAALQTNHNINELEKRTIHHLKNIGSKSLNTKYPGVGMDWLFPPDYIHQHRPPDLECERCVSTGKSCNEYCTELGCDSSLLIARARLSPEKSSPAPKIHFGRFASADQTPISGTDRDKLVKEEKIVAFDVASSGVWDSLPTIFIKSASDYADSHKRKDWSTYAAATAAATLVAVLEKWHNTDNDSPPKASASSGTVPSKEQKLSDDSDSEDRFSRIQTYVRHNYNRVGSITGNVTFQ